MFYRDLGFLGFLVISLNSASSCSISNACLSLTLSLPCSSLILYLSHSVCLSVPLSLSLSFCFSLSLSVCLSLSVYLSLSLFQGDPGVEGLAGEKGEKVSAIFVYLQDIQ